MSEPDLPTTDGDDRPVVLVVDDEPTVRELFVHTLERGGYRVLEAATGHVALALLADHRVDVVLLDRSMPDMPGDVLLHRLRSDARTRRISVVMVTGDAAIESRVDGLEAGANDYLIKPVAMRELLARVGAQLEDRTRWRTHLEEKLATRARLSRELAKLPPDLQLTQLETELRRILALEFALDHLEIRPRPVREDQQAETGCSVTMRRTADGRAGVHAMVPLRTSGRVFAELHVETACANDESVPTLVDLAPQIAARLCSALHADRASEDTQRWVREVVASGGLRGVYQPIVQLSDRTVVGFEGLSRFVDGTAPDVAFRAARRAGVGEELESAAMRRLIGDANLLPADCWLSVNLSATTLGSMDLEDLRHCARPLILELTEHEHVADYAALRARSAELPSIRLAVDDVGAGYASLRHIVELEPHVVKLDRSWVAGIDRDPVRQAMVRGMVGFTDAIAATVVGEGIEREEEARTLTALGVELGQGYLFGRPTASPPSSSPDRLLNSMSDRHRG